MSRSRSRYRHIADEIRQIDYYYATVPDKPGEAARILGRLLREQRAANGAGIPVVLFNRIPLVPWPVFNLADAFVFTGAVMLLGRELLRRPAKAEPAPPAMTAEGDQAA